MTDWKNPPRPTPDQQHLARLRTAAERGELIQTPRPALLPGMVDQSRQPRTEQPFTPPTFEQIEAILDRGWHDYPEADADDVISADQAFFAHLRTIPLRPGQPGYDERVRAACPPDGAMYAE